jgi:large subunit ribosomal protein L17e
LRVHYKHCREICSAIKGMQLTKAKTYLENVLVQKDGIPFTKYTGGIGRHAVAKKYKVSGDKVGFPTKATKSFLDMLRNLESNVEFKGLDIEQVKITHAQANQAPNMRRRTYRAHGRIGPYMSCPAHIELIAEEANTEIAKEADTGAEKVSRKRAAQLRAKKVQAEKA